MAIREHHEWVQAIREAVATAHDHYATRGWFDSHDIVNWLNEHHNDILNEIVDHYRLTADGTPAQDPVHQATVQIGNFMRDWMGQDKTEYAERRSARRVNLSDGTTRHGDSEVSVWSVLPQTQLGNPSDRTANM